MAENTGISDTSGIETVRMLCRIALQYFAEAAEDDPEELLALEKAEAQLENTLSDSDKSEHKLSLARLIKWRTKQLQTGKQPTVRQYRKLLRENYGGDLAAEIQRVFHPDAPVTGQKKPQLTIDALEIWLGSNGITVRRNLITHQIELRGIPDGELAEEQVASQGAAYIHDKVKKDYSCSILEVGSDLQIIAGRNEFNPVFEMIETAEPWDGRDRFSEVFEILGIQDDELSRTLVYKFLLQAYCLQFNSSQLPFTAEGVLVLVGPQSIGKTSFFRKLAYMPQLFAEGITLDGNDKDSQIRATSCWLCELGELDGTLHKSSAAFLKSFLLKDSDSIRAPYAAAPDVNRRRTSHCGTCNEAKFLVDPTGNRRFWTVPVTNIDLEKLRSDFDVLQLWREIAEQVKAASNSNPNFVQECFRLSRDELNQLNERNGGFEKPLPGEDEIRDIIARSDIESSRFEWRFATLTEFVQEHNIRISVNKLRPAIERIAANEDRISESRSRPDDKQRGRYYRLPMFKYKNTSLVEAVEEKLKNG